MDGYVCLKCNDTVYFKRPLPARLDDYWVCPECSHKNSFDVNYRIDDRTPPNYETECRTNLPEEDSFKKADGGKPRLELLDPVFITGIGKILTFGADKYGANNWQSATPEDVERVKGALLRHLMSYLGGEKLDPETGEPHLYHIGCNTMFLDYHDRKEMS